MGNAAFFYYPRSLGPLKKVNLGRRFSQILEWEVRRETVSTAISGSRTKVIWTSLSMVRVSAEYLTDYSGVVRPLEALVNYLKSGGVIALTEDTDAVYGAYAQFPPGPGTTAVDLHTNLFSSWGTTSSLVAGDPFVLQGPSPEYLREKVPMLSTGSGGALTLSSAPVYDYVNEAWVFVRDARFWPYLRLPEGGTNQPILTTDRRINWKLDLQLEEAIDFYDTASVGFDTAWPSEDDVEGTLDNYNDVVRGEEYVEADDPEGW